MNFKKYILAPALIAVLGLGMTGCKDDDFTETIFPEVSDDADPASATYQFDTWLNQNFRDKYNVRFVYKLVDNEIDKNYNLVPADIEQSKKIAAVLRYLWFDVYDKVAGESLLKGNAPRMIQLIGSAAHNPSTSTMVRGLAEGGIKVSLFNVNNISFNDFENLNEYCIRTMHHEFAHILHQAKTYPNEFAFISNGLYNSDTWQNKNGGQALSQGFITPYSSDQVREDFAETIANYVTRTDEQLEFMYWVSKHGWYTGVNEDEGESATDIDVQGAYYYPTKESMVADSLGNDGRQYFLTFPKGTYSIGIIAGDPTKPTTIDGDARMMHTGADVEAYMAEVHKQWDVVTTDPETGKETVETRVFYTADEDKVDGYDVLTRKLTLARDWLKKQWNVDLDALRAEVQYRQTHMDLEPILREIDAIPIPGK